jgi:hypothetical protein
VVSKAKGKRVAKSAQATQSGSEVTHAEQHASGPKRQKVSSATQILVARMMHNVVMVSVL